MKDCTPGLYEHYKGKRYEVLGTARFSEDPTQEFVVYRALYESKLEPEGVKLPAGSLWVRPKTMFMQMIVDQAGKLVPRFKKVE